MAHERSLTPEKQLLNLIESPKTKDAAIRSNIVKRHSMQLLSPGAWNGKLSFFKNYFKKGLRGGFRQPDLKAINRLLTIIMVVLICYLMNILYFSITSLKKRPGLKLIAQEGAKSAHFKGVSVLEHPPAYYVDKIRQRDIFKMGAKKVVKGTTKAVPTPMIVEATQHLKLVGISWSNDPDAMIEDTRAVKTFFIKRGQMIGQVKIEAIFKDRVILSYGGEEVELR